MGTALTFRIVSELEAMGFKQAADHMRGLSRVAGENTEANKSNAGSVDLVKKAYEALQALGVVEFYRQAIDAAAEATENELQLSNRVEQTGLSYERSKPKLDGFFEALQNQSGIAKDKLIPAFNFLVDKTQEVRTSQELLTTVMGLSRARGLQLAQAADLVAGAYNGDTRALRELGRMMGLTAEQSKEQEKVIAQAKDRFADLARNTDAADAAIKRFQLAWSNLQETVGLGVRGPLTQVMNWLTAAIAGFMGFGETLSVLAGAAAAWFNSIIEGVQQFGLNYFKVLKHVEAANAQLQTDMEAAFDEIAAKIDRALHPERYQAALDNLVDQTKKAFESLNEEQRKLIAEGNESVASGDDQRLARRIQLLDAEKAVLLDNLRQQEDFRRVSAENQAALELAIEQKAIGAKRKLMEESLRQQYEIFFQASAVLGVATARMLRGQQDAWKDFTINVIDMIAQKAQAHVLAASFEEAGEHAIFGDYAGAAAALGRGVAWTGLIAGIAEGAKMAIGGGGSGAASGGSGGSSNVALPNSTASAGAAAPVEDRRQSITVYVTGDIVDGDAFVENLAARLSDKVENNDVRLVSSGTRS